MSTFVIRRALFPSVAPRTAFFSTSILRTSGAGIPKRNIFEESEGTNYGEESKSKYLEKYANKIKKTLAEEKVSSVEELKKKIANSSPGLKAPKDEAPAEPSAKAKAAESGTKAKPKVPSNSKRGPQLNDILKIESTEEIPADLLVKMWSYHHSTKEAYVSGSLTADTFKIFRERTKACKLFVIPIPRAGGYETYMMEATPRQVAFVSLIEFKLHRENAQPCLVLDFFTELLEPKGITLFRGLVEEKKISREEGTLLVNLLFNLYTSNEEGFRLVEQFRFKPETFDINKVIELVEKVKAELPSSAEQEKD